MLRTGLDSPFLGPHQLTHSGSLTGSPPVLTCASMQGSLCFVTSATDFSVVWGRICICLNYLLPHDLSVCCGLKGCCM